VSDGPRFASALALVTLRSIRRYVRRSHAVMMTVFFTIVYALGSMTLGGMLLLAHVGGGYTVEVLWSSGTGLQSWNYPGLLVVAPWGVVSLPFFATVAMVLVSVGVGIGMTVAVLLGVALVRRRGKSAGQPAAVGSLAGLTPAMIALLTLGACCSTTAAATAGVGLVAQVSGSSTDTLLLNNWYLGVFQVAVVWTALIAQELLLRVYGGLFGLPTDSAAATATPSPPRLGRRFLVGSTLRVGLLVGGVTWSLAMLVDWTSVAPTSASVTDWVRWVVQHQLIAFLAILAALFPRGLAATFARAAGTSVGRLTRGVLLVAGLSLAVGVPPPIAGWGVEGFGNELMGLFGVPAGWGAVAPVFSPGLDLYFRWGVQYLLLGGFSVAVALAPARALSPIQWSVGEPARRRSDGSEEVGLETPSSPAIGGALPGERLPPASDGVTTGPAAVPSR
jgi:hypothetical protein